MIEANKANVSRRRLFGDKAVFTATAILGSKAVDIELDSHKGVRGAILELDHEETFTESNLAAQLEVICMIILAEWDIAQKIEDAE